MDRDDFNRTRLDIKVPRQVKYDIKKKCFGLSKCSLCIWEKYPAGPFKISKGNCIERVFSVFDVPIIIPWVWEIWISVFYFLRVP